MNADQVVQLLQPDGMVSRIFPGFESRSAQLCMMRSVIDAYNNENIALIEAGTGTGKSLAYLVPALLWASQRKERTVISTNTIALQEQLIQKDIPFLLKALQLDLKSTLVKGMSNYICLRRLEEIRFELRFLDVKEAQEIEKIDIWKENTKDGSRSDLPFMPSHEAWERVCAEGDACSFRKCPFYEKCHFFQARKQASDSQILVVNHHMLFADLSARGEDNNYNNPCILPNYNRIILDEAHNIEDVATDFFAARTSHFTFLKSLSKLLSDKQGKLLMLKEKLHSHFVRKKPSGYVNLMNKLEIDLPILRNELYQQIGSIFQTYELFAEKVQKFSLTNIKNEDSLKTETKLRVLSEHHNIPLWLEKVIPETKRLKERVLSFSLLIDSIEKDIENLNDDRFNEFSKGLRLEIEALTKKISNASNIIELFTEPSDKAVRWIESQHIKTGHNIHLVNAELDISKHLVASLFSKFQTIILCSATLTTNRKFDFIRQRLGLNASFAAEREIKEYAYDSPFDFKKQSLLAIPTDLPQPTHPDFIPSASEKIFMAIQASRGNAFVLFTSYAMLKSCFYHISDRLHANKYTVFKQGDEHRQTLLSKFRETNRSVLFGTDSFWEGIDVVGEALRCVIIVKLPFKVPSEPIIQARTEAILQQGGDPFMDYSLPNAIVKFKQGFGRLIRHKTDRGCVVCLDSRILNKGYGKQFINSLPDCQQAFLDSNSLQQTMSDFYRKTHYLTKVHH